MRVVSKVVQDVTGDTHAVSDVVDGQATGNAEPGAGTGRQLKRSADIGIVETTIHTYAAITVSGANNILACAGAFRGIKLTNAGTVTARIKNGAATLISLTSASIGAGVEFWLNMNGTALDLAPGAVTLSATLQASTTGLSWDEWTVGVIIISISLTGSPGTCT